MADQQAESVGHGDADVEEESPQAKRARTTAGPSEDAAVDGQS